MIARARFETEIADLYLFGSTVRGEASGLSSDVDILVVLTDDTAKEETADALRAIAYDVMLEYEPVVELHILSGTKFEHAQDNPFIQNVIHDGRAYARC